ncbi:hypothetical protein BRAS3809_6810008 [Bradyrhizobium sp. STM 3809]|nr:hypothetical protein BRAS3809_6810008 [Bradyrhizobium sp. STM 3809]
MTAARHAGESEMMVADTNDLDPQETSAWLEAPAAVRGHRGDARARFIVRAVLAERRRGHRARQGGIPMGSLGPRGRQWPRRGLYQAAV